MKKMENMMKTIKEKRYSVISLHPYTDCNLQCGFCYKSKSDKSMEKPEQFWYDLIPYMAKLTNQVACLHPDELIFIYNPLTKGLNSLKIRCLTGSGEAILGNGGLNNVKEVIKHKTNEMLYKVVCTRGREFRATENHLVLTKRGLVAVKDLKIDEEIIINKKLDIPLIKSIDLEKFFKEKYNSRIEDGKLITERVYYTLPPKIEITNEFARLCGFYCSEGSSKCFSLGGDETKYGNIIIDDFYQVFNLKRKIRYIQDKNSLVVEIPKFIGKNIFQEICDFGKEAKEKRFGVAFSFNREKTLYFLQGLYSGDGCLRVRKTGFSLEYKTSSKDLAEQLRLILEGKLGVSCSVTTGMNPIREIEGRTLQKSRYYAVSIYGDKDLEKLKKVMEIMPKYPLLIERLNRDRSKYSNPKPHQKNKIIKIIPLGRNKEVIDIKLKDKPNLFTINGNVVVHNCGGGEPFMNMEFIKQMAKRCKKQGLLFNVTSNGRLLMAIGDKELKETLKDITMCSLSYDDFKIQTKQDQDNYFKLVKRIHGCTGCQVGANLLINQKMFEKGGRGLVDTVNLLFRQGVDRVFCLGVKNMPIPDILRFKHLYMLLTYKFKFFYADDMTKMVMEEGSYGNWKHSCHYAKDLVSIDETGRICGCSFDPKDKALLKLEKPSDLMKITKVKVCERFNCPYLIKPIK